MLSERLQSALVVGSIILLIPLLLPLILIKACTEKVRASRLTTALLLLYAMTVTVLWIKAVI